MLCNSWRSKCITFNATKQNNVTGCNLGGENFSLLGRNSLRWEGIYVFFKLLTSVWSCGCVY